MLLCSGSKEGPFRLEFLCAGDKAGPAYIVNLDEPGELSLEAPENTGPVHVVACVDVDGDGPSATAPAGRLSAPVTIGTSPVSGIAIEISDDPELGDLTPGGGQDPMGIEGAAEPGGEPPGEPAGPALDADGNPVDDGTRPPPIADADADG